MAIGGEERQSLAPVQLDSTRRVHSETGPGADERHASYRAHIQKMNSDVRYGTYTGDGHPRCR